MRSNPRCTTMKVPVRKNLSLSSVLEFDLSYNCGNYNISSTIGICLEKMQFSFHEIDVILKNYITE